MLFSKLSLYSIVFSWNKPRQKLNNIESLLKVKANVLLQWLNLNSMKVCKYIYWRHLERCYITIEVHRSTFKLFFSLTSMRKEMKYKHKVHFKRTCWLSCYCAIFLSMLATFRESWDMIDPRQYFKTLGNLGNMIDPRQYFQNFPMEFDSLNLHDI